MSLIDSKNLKRVIMDGCFLPDCAMVLVNRLIDDLSSVDAVPVVRCKDCKHFYMYLDGKCVCCLKGNEFTVKPDDFCSYGERKQE